MYVHSQKNEVYEWKNNMCLYAYIGKLVQPQGSFTLKKGGLNVENGEST